MKSEFLERIKLNQTNGKPKNPTKEKPIQTNGKPKNPTKEKPIQTNRKPKNPTNRYYNEGR